MRINYATDSLLINESLEKVFNFVSRGACYDRWHFDYHLGAEVMDVKEEVVGSVFSIEELIGGFYLKHVGRVVEFERNRKFVWLGRFAIFPLIWIGTDFTFEEAAPGTRYSTSRCNPGGCRCFPSSGFDRTSRRGPAGITFAMS
jgi:hypothetical protein